MVKSVFCTENTLHRQVFAVWVTKGYDLAGNYDIDIIKGATFSPKHFKSVILESLKSYFTTNGYAAITWPNQRLLFTASELKSIKFWNKLSNFPNLIHFYYLQISKHEKFNITCLQRYTYISLVWNLWNEKLNYPQGKDIIYATYIYIYRNLLLTMLALWGTRKHSAVYLRLDIIAYLWGDFFNSRLDLFHCFAIYDVITNGICLLLTLYVYNKIINIK